MSRGAYTFKQRDVTRALKATLAAGLKVARIEIDKEGRIVILTPRMTAAPASAYDTWKAEQDAC